MISKPTYSKMIPKANEDSDAPVTTFTSLNLALTEKSICSRVWWSLITIATIAILITSTAFQVLKYTAHETSVITKIKSNRLPFPAVTFCNLNPYKKSAAENIPALADLFDQFSNASTGKANQSTSKANQLQSPSKANIEESETGLRKKRRKRLAGVCCASSAYKSAFRSSISYPNGTISISLYARCNNNVTWTDAWACCANNPPAVSSSESITSSRLAWVNKDFDTWYNMSVLTFEKAFCGMASANQSGSPFYYWHDTATTYSGSPVNVSNICSTCLNDNATWNFGGVVTVSTQQLKINFNNYANTVQAPYICEYAGAPSSTSVALTTSLTKTSNPTTSASSQSTSILGTSESSQSTSSSATNSPSTKVSSMPTSTASGTTFISSSSSIIATSTNASTSMTNSATVLNSVSSSTILSAETQTSVTATSASTSIATHSTPTSLSSTTVSTLLPTTTLSRSTATTTSVFSTSTLSNPLSSSGSGSSKVSSLPTSTADSTTRLTTSTLLSSPSTTKITSLPSTITPSVSITTASPSSTISSTISTSVVASTSMRLSSETLSTTCTSLSSSTSKSSISSSTALGSSSTKATLAPTSSSILTTFTSPTSTRSKLTSASSRIVNPSTKTVVSMAAAITAEIQKALDEVKNEPMALSAVIKDIMPFQLASLPPEVAIAAGFSAKELIMRCVYNGVKCLPSNFRLTLDQNYGNCYTFNADGDRMVASEAGESRGLSFTVLVGEDQYMDHTQVAGVRIVVHGQNETVFPDNHGFNAASGFQTSASVAMMQHNALSTSEKPCIETNDQVQTFNYNTSYSPEACLRSCYQKSVIANCGCGDPRVPLPDNSEVGYCNMLKRNCVNDCYDHTESVGDATCKCPSACRTTIFEMRSRTAVKWSQNQDDYLRATSNNSADKGYRSSSQLAKIDVYYRELTIVEYTEEAAYTILDFMWELSEFVGLFLGVSVISVFEIVRLKKCLKKEEYILN